MSQFRAVLVEGTFNRRGTPPRLTCATLRGPVLVAEALLPLVGSDVAFAAHHVPDLSRAGERGLGSCSWPDGVPCPFGHHEAPNRMYQTSVEGVLRLGEGDDEWYVEAFDGTRTPLLLGRMLDGHQGRVLAATKLDVESMREKVVAAGLAGAVEELVGKTAEMKDLLARLRGGGA